MLTPFGAAFVVASTSGIAQPLMVTGLTKATGNKPLAQKMAIGATALLAASLTLSYDPSVEEFVYTGGMTLLMGVLREKTNKQWDDSWSKKQKFYAYLESLVAPFVFATLTDLLGSLEMMARMRLWPS